MFSNVIIDPKTKEHLLISDLLNGVRTNVSEMDLRNYDMFPMSGTIKNINGDILSLVDLLETAGSNSGSGGGPVSGEWRKYFEELAKEHKNDLFIVNNKIITINDLIEQIKTLYGSNFIDVNSKIDKNILNIDGLDKTLEALRLKVENLSKFDTGMSYQGLFPTFDIMTINIKEPKTGFTVLIGDQNAKKLMYIYNGIEWESFGEFNFEVRDFTVKPIDLSKEITGKLDLKNVDISSIKDSLSSVLIQEDF